MTSKVHQAISAAPEIDRVLRETQNTPFTPCLLNIPVRHPGKIKIPTYSGTSDPIEYLTAFSISMGRANFPPEECDEQSASNADLWTLEKGPTKTLRSFIDKFRAIVSRITELFKNKPQTLEDALHRAVTFIEIEKDKAVFAKKYATTKKSSSKDKESNEYSGPRQHYDKAYKDNKNRKAGTYQISEKPTNRSTGKRAHDDRGSADARTYCSYYKTMTHNTEECRHLQAMLLSQYRNDIDSSSKDQQNKTTPKNEGERFRKVQEERERKQKLSSERENAETEKSKNARDDRNNEQRHERTPPPRRVINVIMGGLQTCKDSVRSIKEYKRKTLTSQKWGSSSSIEDTPDESYKINFTEKDTKGLDKPHNDPRVVELRIGDCEVTRVLIDTGSSVDLIFSKTLQRMDVKDYELKP
ncbi:hypothetical protein N665_0228s0002 [Sinapis alba]|nr:hypothetical protein N665_0228s0002 [Sinapis alba]